jgi:uncharacterized protein YecE (DUF72 family)
LKAAKGLGTAKSKGISISSNSGGEIRVGCAGWTIPREFAAKFCAQGTHLEKCSQVLNCAEINSSFYRPHKAQTWERWETSVPETFKFSVKAPKTITHEAKLQCRSEELQAFLSQLAPLVPRLGPLLFQLPPSFQFERKVVAKFLGMLRELHSGGVAWEPRHPTWFTADAEKVLENFQISRVAADPACVPDAARPGGWKGLIYYRLHGSPRRYYSAYSEEFLRELATDLLSHPEANRWCIFDNTASGAAMGNALELSELLKFTGSK